MKKIETAQDLALNGASPLSDKCLHVGGPNIGSRDAFIKYVDEIFEKQWLSNNGSMVQEFEQKIAEYHGVKYCVAMCNGTVALEIAIRALGLEDEVIVPSYTFIATAHSLQWQAIKPVFADIDPLTHNLSPDAVRRMITPRTTGIIGVHLWGRSSPVEELQEIADEHNLKLMFDAAHAFGCSNKGVMIGNFGLCEVLSFHATKFFNSFEGGAVLTNDDELAETMRLMRNFGFLETDNVVHVGTNGKMIEVAAAMGLVNLNSIDKVLEINRRNYEVYQKGLSDLPCISLLAFDNSERSNYQYVVMEVADECLVSRDSIIQALHAENVIARKYFWPGCHKMKPYIKLDPHAGQHLPHTERVANKVVVLPTGTAVDVEMIESITSVIRVLLLDV